MTESRSVPRWQERIGGRWAISWQSYVVGVTLNVTILALTGGQIGAQSVRPSDIGAWVALGIVAALIVEMCHRRWPTRWHLNSVLWTLCFGGGYFLTLHYTTSVAWQTSVWTGILIIMMLISYALARISNPYATPTGVNR